MSRKVFIQTVTFALFVLAVLALPLSAQAGGVCGGAYTIEKGDTVEKLAAMCGTTTAAIYAANPGLKEPLIKGQTITIPGANYGAPTTAVVTTPSTPIPVTVTPTPVIVNNYNTYNYYNYYNYYPSTTYNGSYVVQPGDTFSNIAYRFGLTIYDLWAANPYIYDINYLYVGQTLYIPANYWAGGPAPISAEEPVALSYPGDIPKGAPQGTVKLVNKANGDVYISLRTSRADGTNAINEYPVNGTLSADIPVGWIDYVAWVGGVKFTGGFKLSEGEHHTITFSKSKVVVD